MHEIKNLDALELSEALLDTYKCEMCIRDRAQ